MESKWSDRMLDMAKQWSSYSTCLRKHVGAVIFDPESKGIISVGYNDTPINWINCSDGGCYECQGSLSTSLYIQCRCLHAESNAVFLAARRGIAVEDCWIAVTFQPCTSCIKMFVQVGIKAVVLDETVDLISEYLTESYQKPGEDANSV